MKPFDHSAPPSLERAIQELSTTPGSAVLAGGTDLLRALRSGIAETPRVVSLKEIADLSEVKPSFDGGLKIGARVTLAALAGHPVVRQRYTALAEAAAGAATPQIRNAATLAGNVLQRPNCEYYRGDFDCPLKPGIVRSPGAEADGEVPCPARDGDATHHAILGGGFCVSAHPSDAAAALLALDARVTWRDPRGEHTAAVAALHRSPDAARPTEVALPADAIITAFHLPPFTGRSAYVQSRERRTWAFALAGVAARIHVQNGRVTEAGIAVSGAAPVPWRLIEAEKALTGAAVNDLDIGGIAALAVRDARPLRDNAYKVRLVRGLVSRVLESLLAAAES